MKSLLQTALACCALFTVGCEWLKNLQTGAKVDNPVMGPPPPRVNLGREQRTADASSDPTGIQQAGLSSDAKQPTLAGNEVVATVNGAPILAGDVLQRYKFRLQQVEKQATPAQLRKVRERLIRQDLQNHIERRLLVTALEKTIPKESRSKLDGYIDNLFAEEIDRLKSEMKAKGLKVETREDVDRELAKQGESLANLRHLFADQRMAVEYLVAKSKKPAVVGREEMLEYYKKHRDEKYSHKSRARHQEIRISFAKHGGKSAAFEKMDEAVAALGAGQNFDEVAKKHSDGLHAAEGGHWDWIRPGSLTEKRVDQAIFELPVGQISQVIEGKSAFYLIEVTEREPARYTPFAEVQAEIKKKLENELARNARKKVLEKLLAEATIWTILQELPEPDDDQPLPFR